MSRPRCAQQPSQSCWWPPGCRCQPVPSAGCRCGREHPERLPRAVKELGKLFSSQLDNPDYYLVSRSGLLIKLGTAGFAVPAACFGRGIYLLLTREGN